jgi:hypothetical protein
MNKKEMKRNIRPKSEGLVEHISESSDLLYNLNLKQESSGENSVRIGHRSTSPPAPDQITVSSI